MKKFFLVLSIIVLIILLYVGITNKVQKIKSGEEKRTETVVIYITQTLGYFFCPK